MLSHWSLDPGLVYVFVSGGLYVAGARGRGRPAGWQMLAFFAGLATIVIALDSPIDDYADDLFWVHMVQHILLLTVAPPLILLGKPWPTIWRAIPLGQRTAVARAIGRARWTAPLRAVAHPLPAWVLFNATLVGWHIPAAYELTLTNGLVHLVEHALFFFTGLLFWARVIDPGPLRPRLVWPMRLAYIAAAMVVSWILAITLVLVPHALYHHYAALTTRPGGLSAVDDQQIAAGIMWVPGSLAFLITGLIGLYRWLQADWTRPSSGTALTTVTQLEEVAS